MKTFAPCDRIVTWVPHLPRLRAGDARGLALGKRLDPPRHLAVALQQRRQPARGPGVARVAEQRAQRRQIERQHGRPEVRVAPAAHRALPLGDHVGAREQQIQRGAATAARGSRAEKRNPDRPCHRFLGHFGPRGGPPVRAAGSSEGFFFVICKRSAIVSTTEVASKNRPMLRSSHGAARSRTHQGSGARRRRRARQPRRVPLQLRQELFSSLPAGSGEEALALVKRARRRGRSSPTSACRA